LGILAPAPLRVAECPADWRCHPFSWVASNSLNVIYSTAKLIDCMTGPNDPSIYCGCTTAFDWDGDRDIDLKDVGGFMRLAGMLRGRMTWHQTD